MRCTTEVGVLHGVLYEVYNRGGDAAWGVQQRWGCCMGCCMLSFKAWHHWRVDTTLLCCV